jgi:hypothetical protein
MQQLLCRDLKHAQTNLVMMLNGGTTDPLLASATVSQSLRVLRSRSTVPIRQQDSWLTENSHEANLAVMMLNQLA